MFRNAFSFEGRIRRTEFGISLIIYYVAIFMLEIIDKAVDSNGLIYIGIIPLFWFIIAQGTKRCHDRGNNGAWQLIPFYMFWMLFADGEPQSNEYGEDPKGRGNLLEQLLSEEQPVQ